MSGTTDPAMAPWHPRTLLPWLVPGAMLVGLMWSGMKLQADNQIMLGKLTDLQGSIAGIRSETAGSLAGLRSETAISLASLRVQTDALPKVHADMLNLERRIAGLEDSNKTQDSRLNQQSDAIVTLRGQVGDAAAELRSMTSVARLPLTPGRSGR